MNHTAESQRSGLNRRPLGDTRRAVRGITRRDTSLRRHDTTRKATDVTAHRLATVPRLCLALLTLAAAAGRGQA